MVYLYQYLFTASCTFLTSLQILFIKRERDVNHLSVTMHAMTLRITHTYSVFHKLRRLQQHTTV